MKRARVLSATLIAAVVAAPVALTTADDAAAAKRSARAAKMRLVTFDDCSELVGFARRYSPRVEPYYSPGGPVAVDTIVAPPQPAPGTGEAGGSTTDGQATAAPAPASPGTGGGRDSSTTNVQEQGVDEPDAVKTDGDTIFAIANGDLHSVDARSPQPKLLQTLELGGQGQQLLVHGKKLLVIGSSFLDMPVSAAGAPEPGIAPSPPYYYKPVTFLTEVDISDPAAMKMIRTETIEGNFVSARLTGDTTRIVITSPPAAFAPDVPDTAERRISGWVPKSGVFDRRSGKMRRRTIVKCKAVRHPRTFAGLDMLTVLTIDMSRGLPAVDADSLMTSAETVYASADSLYVATHRWTRPPTAPNQPPPKATTAIHRFDTSDENTTTYKASGEVPGYVLNQWSMSEYKNVLRVASTQDPEWWNGAQQAQSQSFVTTLAERNGALEQIGSVGGLGQGERIFGVRFIEDTGYVVTFRQTDPLYTIDLSTPTAPRVLGELKILGYSAYLHPLAPDLLLGVGQDATEQGRQLGTQLSVFDVSNLSSPQRIQQLRLARGSSSSAEFDHHAFLYWDPLKLAVIPVREYSSSPPFLGAVGFKVDRSTIAEVGRTNHDWLSYPAEVDRSVIVGDRLFTVSGLGVKANDLGSFGDIGRAEFPQPPPQEVQPGPCGRGGDCVAIP